MRGCWAQDGARWASGSCKPWLAAVGSDLRFTQIADGAGQAGIVLAKDDRGVQRVPDLGASHGLRLGLGQICDDADRGRRAAQLVGSTILGVEPVPERGQLRLL